MAHPERELRRLDAEIAALESALATSADTDPQYPTLEARHHALTAHRRRLRRLNPPAAEQRIETVPRAVLAQLPGHWSQWYVLRPDSARYRHRDRDTRFFIQRHGQWQETDSVTTGHLPGERAYALRRYRSARAAQAASVSLAALPEVRRPAPADGLRFTETDDNVVTIPVGRDTGEVAKHSLDIELVPGVNTDERRLVLDGPGGYHIQRTTRGPEEGAHESVRFGKLKEGDAYTLTAVHRAERRAVFEHIPFAILAEPGKLHEHLDTPDDDALLHILDHQKRGDRPILRASLEAPQFGLFADGTDNNRSRDREHETKRPTNVAKLYELYPEIIGGAVRRRYVEGVGTRNGEERNFSDLLDLGIAHRFGRRIAEAIAQIQTFFRRFPSAAFGYLDLFGFSRGAALIRALVNAIHHINGTDPGYWGGPVVVIRFVGLFDTVGSVGRPGNNRNDNPVANFGFPGPVILDLHPKAAQAVYHLTARDEVRKNFPLSSIKPADGSLPAHFVEDVMPGVHSDVGGGYRSGPDTVYYPPKQFLWRRRAELEQDIALAREAYQARYGVPPGAEIEPVIGTDRPHPGGLTATRVGFQAVRFVREDLAYVALERMYAAAVANGVPLKPLATLGQKRYAYQITDELRALVEHAERDGPGSEAYETLYRKYIHHSHQYHRPPFERGNRWQDEGTKVFNSNAPRPRAERFTRTKRIAATRRTISGGGRAPTSAGGGHDEKETRPPYCAVEPVFGRQLCVSTASRLCGWV
ncbi:hypothetical protein CAI21_10155 [Alkalilimnicola ehrlichii]|uniref:T6SS Phospholipase effector Tle1-like catalytic domain-containing protein n=1 Tax=Alkalilimnicola ehrlichii TaxID=351052 RepID=A0A3E0WIF0_9GAMM|nr:DUF2235 domain-containing protein [Alkalilimnicola ehrlichii]RFA29413.1 hypothetical protein CAI21_10155 [Alkalilimnicola ehrlichii]RFA31931.1 hypothetical protein CAL65_21000 [Alkalilimnicola ehrlichii]